MNRKQLRSWVILLICLLPSANCAAEEGIMWVGHDGNMYDPYDINLTAIDLHGSMSRTPYLQYPRVSIIETYEDEPNGYIIRERSERKSSHDRKKDDRFNLLHDIMYFNGHTYDLYEEGFVLDSCYGFVAYVNNYIYYIKKVSNKKETLPDDGEAQTLDQEKSDGINELPQYYLARRKRGAKEEILVQLLSEYEHDSSPAISEHGDIVYVCYDEEKDQEWICYVSDAGEKRTLTEGGLPVWLDANAVLYVKEKTLYQYDLGQSTSEPFLTEQGQPLTLPVDLGTGKITINKKRDKLAFFVLRPNGELPPEFSEVNAVRPVIVSLKTGEATIIKEPGFIGGSYIVGWWGE